MYALTDSSVVADACQSRKLPGASDMSCSSPTTFRSKRTMRRSGRSNGSGRSRKALTMLKIAVLAPMPSASTATTASANEGARRNTRVARRRSETKLRMNGSLPWEVVG
jgi:hypothetical protein